MSWITVLWLMNASACLTLACVHLVVWVRERTLRSHLLFATTVMTVAIFSALELMMMRAQTPDEYARMHRLAHVTIFFMILSLLFFVRTYIGTGRPWLLWTAVGLRSVVLLLTFSGYASFNFVTITGLRGVSFLGETVVLPIGVPTPWRHLGIVSIGVVLAYVVDAAARLWHHGNGADRHRALTVGGSVAICILMGNANAVVTHGHWLPVPLMISLFFLPLILAMGNELSHDLVRSARLARQLRESEQRIQLAADAAKLGLWEWDVTRESGWVTGRARDVLGCSPSGPVDIATLFHAVHQDDRRTVSQAVRRAIDEGREYEVEFRINGLSGPLRWVLARGHVQRDDQGRPALLRGVVVDVTPQKQVQSRLREGEARLASAVAVAALGMYELRCANGTVILDERGQEIIGLSSGEVRSGRRFWIAHLHPEDTSRLLEVDRSLSSGQRDVAVIEYRLRHPTRGAVWVHEQACVIERDVSGRALVQIGVLQDITERREAEMRLAAHRLELAHVSRLSVMGELSASMAHELKQPLTAILTNARAGLRFLASGQADMVEYRQILIDIANDTTRARDVLGHLRSLATKRDAEFARTEINEVIHQVVTFLHSDIVNRNVSVSLRLASTLPSVIADRVQIQQVLLNLLLNAFDAIGGVTSADRVVMVMTCLVEDPTAVRISVRDRGVGFRAHDTEKLFEAFYTTKKDGLGMGLAVSRTIVEAHGGRIWAESSPEGGSTFHFTVPVAAENDRSGADGQSV